MPSSTNKKPQSFEHSFDRKRHTLGLFIAPLFALIIFFLPIPGLTLSAHKLLAIMTLVSLWWITEPVPIAVTSLLGPTLAVIFGVISVKDGFAPFANPIIFLFMGGFILAKAMMVHGLDKRFAFGLLSMKWVGSSPTRIFLAIGIASMLCSGWVSNTATAAMMMPIALGLLTAIKDMFAANGRNIHLHEYKYATGLMLMTAYAASIGGVLTPIGTPPNLIMLGFLDQMANIKISFFEWMTWGSIAMIFYFIITYLLLKKLFPADVSSINGAKELIDKKVQELGSWTQGQKNTAFAFGLAVCLWIFPGILNIFLGSDSPVLKLYDQLLPESIVAMLAALLLFLLPVNWEKRTFTLKWKDAVDGIEWGTLILFGGGLSLGHMMYTTGLSKWIGDGIANSLGEPNLLMIVTVFSLLALIMSELTSHTAATNMVGPLGITAALSAGFDPTPVAVAIALSASLGFMLPVSTPPNAIVYASGYVPITKMISTGFIIDLIGIFLITIPIVIYFVTWILS
ncbi:SLC13 family permease [Anaerosinus gibii]|uniref:Sodium-dependent dicarboxylate transporter SdcS n=1 Tax=Selenobaculum gibii TaxID=3054208 RepID=A0A9Y2ETN4_9FIRM|nr:DASS family sodium-coupled anion symporter [Selenobaculum gbiensis]WIW70250.1 DASS family sodium-coupled anion symporter [Selenobaculum gbiensis]